MLSGVVCPGEAKSVPVLRSCEVAAAEAAAAAAAAAHPVDLLRCGEKKRCLRSKGDICEMSLADCGRH